MGPLFLLVLSSSLLLFPSNSHALCVPRNSSHSHHPHPPPTAASPPPPTKVLTPPPAHHSPPPPAPHRPPPGGNTSLKDICAHTDNPKLCDTLLVPYLPGTGLINAQVVLGAHMKACTDHTSKAAYVVTKLLSNPLIPSMTAASLRVCKDSYADAVDNLDQAQTALGAGDKATLNIMVSAAMTNYETCEDGFMELPGIVSPMAVYDEILTKIASNCLAIAELI